MADSRMSELYRLSACEMVSRLKSEDVSVHDALDSLQQRIQQTDPIINALPTLCFDRARYPGSDGEVPYAEYYRWLAIAYAVTISALPVITMPCGFAHNGMPVGVQLIGKPGGELELFCYARFIEQMTDWSALPVDPIV